MFKNKYFFFYFFVISLFLCIISVELFSDGMFMDGLMYATISRNMSIGLGTFWKPFFSNTSNKEFYGHPPLAFGLQSIMFKIFGDSIYVERFYSLFTYVTLSSIIILIWKKITKSIKFGWLPLLFLFFTKDIPWAASNNILENTMSIFVSLSFLFVLISNENNNRFWLLISGLILSLAVLTKGLTCLFIWTTPIIHWLFYRKINFFNASINTFLIIISTILPILLLYFYNYDSKDFFLNYYNQQLVTSLFQNNIHYENNLRIVIIFEFLFNLLVPILIGILISLVGFWLNFNKNDLFINLKDGFYFLTISLSGVIPIMLSQKQSSFYIISVYPFFAIGFGYFMYPIIKYIDGFINIKSYPFKLFQLFSITLFALFITLSLMQVNRIGRDKETINDVNNIISVIGKNKTINITQDLNTYWSLYGYFARYGNISLKDSTDVNLEYLITKGNINKDLEKRYKLVVLKTNQLILYKKQINTSEF